MGLILEAGLAAAFALSNTPWEQKDTQFQYLLIEKSVYENFYFSAMNSSRTNLTKGDQWNPKTTLWRMAGGYKLKVDNQIFTMELGHQSEHEVNHLDALSESYNFASIKYRVEY